MCSWATLAAWPHSRQGLEFADSRLLHMIPVNQLAIDILYGHFEQGSPRNKRKQRAKQHRACIERHCESAVDASQTDAVLAYQSGRPYRYCYAWYPVLSHNERPSRAHIPTEIAGEPKGSNAHSIAIPTVNTHCAVLPLGGEPMAPVSIPILV